MPSPKSPRLFSRISIAALVLLTSGSALARPEAPGWLVDAAGMECVPQCTMCHLTNPGTISNWSTKPVGQNLFAPIKAEADIKPAYTAWAAANPAAAALVKKGIEPSTGEDVCAPTYGCSVPMVAKEPARPRDYTAGIWVVGAMLVGGILRRRRKTNAR